MRFIGILLSVLAILAVTVVIFTYFAVPHILEKVINRQIMGNFEQRVSLDHLKFLPWRVSGDIYLGASYAQGIDISFSDLLSLIASNSLDTSLEMLHLDGDSIALDLDQARLEDLSIDIHNPAIRIHDGVICIDSLDADLKVGNVDEGKLGSGRIIFDDGKISVVDLVATSGPFMLEVGSISLDGSIDLEKISFSDQYNEIDIKVEEAHFHSETQILQVPCSSSVTVAGQQFLLSPFALELASPVKLSPLFISHENVDMVLKEGLEEGDEGLELPELTLSSELFELEGRKGTLSYEGGAFLLSFEEVEVLMDASLTSGLYDRASIEQFQSRYCSGSLDTSGYMELHSSSFIFDGPTTELELSLNSEEGMVLSLVDFKFPYFRKMFDIMITKDEENLGFRIGEGGTVSLDLSKSTAENISEIISLIISSYELPGRN